MTTSTIYDELLFNKETVNGVKLLEISDTSADELGDAIYNKTVTYNGVEYTAHYWFVNVIDDEQQYIGIQFIDYSGENDIIFGVYGNKRDMICDFDTMFRMVSGK